MSTEPSAANVAQLLADPTTRLSTLDMLEAHGGVHDGALATAAAPALTDLLALDAAEVPHTVFQRVGLLRGRLLQETPVDDRAALFGAMFGEGRLAAELNAQNNVVAAASARGVVALSREDVLSLSCMYICNTIFCARDMALSIRAAGFRSTLEWWGVFMKAAPACP